MDEPKQQSMTELANAAFREAAKKVVRRAIETNTPIIVYRDGAIVNLDPHTMQPIQSLEDDGRQLKPPQHHQS